MVALGEGGFETTTEQESKTLPGGIVGVGGGVSGNPLTVNEPWQPLI